VNKVHLHVFNFIAMCALRIAPSVKRWYKCPVCLGEEYKYMNKVHLHIFNFIANNAGAADVVE
jgi:hypothetical protein